MCCILSKVLVDLFIDSQKWSLITGDQAPEPTHILICKEQGQIKFYFWCCKTLQAKEFQVHITDPILGHIWNQMAVSMGLSLFTLYTFDRMAEVLCWHLLKE